MTAPSHIVLVTLENQNFQDIVGNTAEAPFVNQLISEGMLFTNYISLTHPSQPNYVALFSGSTQGITTSVPPAVEFPSSVPTLASALAAKGLTFAGYGETATDPGHEPWLDFANSAADARNFSAFPTTGAGFAALPTVSFITPSDADDMTPSLQGGGATPIATGDAWLAANIGAYAAWAQANNSLLIITFDENENGAPPNQVATIVVGAGVPAGVTNNQPGNEYALLAGIESLYGLTPVGESAGAPALDFYSATPPTAASAVVNSFSGISDSTYPPANGLAVGPQSAVTVEGSHYQATNLIGGASATGSLATLFGSLGASLDNALSAPRVAYDSSTGRFVLIADNFQPGGGATNIDIAVSKDGNPADGWSVASLDTSNGGTTLSQTPSLSVSGGNIDLAAPESLKAGGSAGTGEWIVSESSIVGGSPQILASETAPASAGLMRNVAGANGVTYYVGAYSSGAQTDLVYQTYSASGGFSAIQTMQLQNSDRGTSGSDYTAQQEGTSLTLDAGDSRIQSLAYANGYLYGVSEVLPAGASAPEIHWFKFDVSNPASPQLVIQGDLSGSLLGNPNIALFNPSLAVDGNGDVLINFTASGPNMYPSDYYVVQGASNSTFSAPTLYQASTSYFASAPGATGVQPWGAYSSAAADPNNPNGFWISNEYVTSVGVTIPSGLGAWWSTAVAQVQVASNAPILGGFLTSAGYNVNGGAVTVDGGLTVTDVASATLTGATVAISSGLLAGDALNFANQAGIVGSYNPTTGVLTLSGTASLAAYQAALDSITYSSSGADPSKGGADFTRTIAWTVSSGATTSTPVTSMVQISGIISGSVAGPLTLTSANNPLLIMSTGKITSTGAGVDAIDGGSAVNWRITNLGAVSSTSAYGVNLAGQGTISNSGSISGAGGVVLANDGSVTNTAQGTITATGLEPTPDATISGIYVTGPSSAGMSAISVTNAGTINAANGYGIGLGASGSVINSGKVTGGEDGVAVFAGVGNLQNTGSIVATVDDGVGFFAGGTVTNAAGASVSGLVGANAAAVFVTGGAATISNSGGMSGLRYGILVSAGGTVTNNSTGTITGQVAGVAMNHGGTINNYGSVSATAAGEAAVDLELGGNVNNYLGGTISGTGYGVFITGATGAIVNSGMLSTGGYYGASLGAGGSVQNTTTGSIVGQTAGVNLANQSGTVVNDGSISATGSGGAAVQLSAGGSVTNDAGATLAAADFGAFASGVAATVINGGKITSAHAVGLEAGGTLTNLSGGMLSGQTDGVFGVGAAVTVNNSGSITASASGGAALDLESAASSVTNNAGGTVNGATYGVFMTGGSGMVSNAANASISGGGTAVYMSGGSGSLRNGGSITTTGSAGVDAEGAGNVVTNASGGTISGGWAGVYLGGPGTVTDLGAISGTSYAAYFGANSSANLLQVGAGATLTGSVYGDGGAIELLSGGSGAIAGISSSGQFWGFQALNVDTGANWALNGSGNSIANVTDNGALTVNGSLDVTGALNAASAGAFNLGAGGSLEVASATGAQTAVDFLGASQLAVDNSALFGTGVGGASYQGSLLESFGAGDSIDIHNFSALGAIFSYSSSSGLLQLSNGGQLATLDFQQSTLGNGSFHLAADVSGSGLLITRT